MSFNDLGQLLVLLIILYAMWQTAGLWLRMPGWFKQAGFTRKRGADHASEPYLRDPNGNSVLLSRLSNWYDDQSRPTTSWCGRSGGYTCWQYVSGVRRAHSFLRRKSLKRTRYNVTIVRLPESASTDLYFCIRPRRSLDSVDYLYVDSEYSPATESDFSRLFFIQTNKDDELERLLSEPVRKLLTDTEDLSLELINDYLILVRITHILDLREHLNTERDTAALLAGHLER